MSSSLASATRRSLFCAGSILLLTACGGGGGGSSSGYTRYCTSGEVTWSPDGCSGFVQAGVANTWSCTRDDTTGLMWVKASEAYVAGGSTPPASLCGRNDWRLPTVRELLSLTKPAKPAAPRIDETGFPDTPAQAFVTAESYLLDVGVSRPWAVNFGDGGGSTGLGSGAASVRWVSGQSARTNPTGASLERQASGSHFLIDDKARRQQWLFQTEPQPQTWAQALAGAATANAAGHFGRKDWRLPTRDELDTLVDRSRKQPALPAIVTQDAPNPALFSNTFWSSTEWQADAVQAWAVNFESGDIGPYNKAQLAGVVYLRTY